MYQTPETVYSTRRSEKEMKPNQAKGVVFGRINKRRLDRDPGIAYYLYSSTRPRPEMPVFIAVHGIRRRAELQARLFAPLIESTGGTMVVPMFNRKRYSDYQRLGRHGKGKRSDFALNRVLRDVYEHTGAEPRRVVMFGYSGGGQFVHRYAMANPRRVRRIAIAAPGWFTFPDGSRAYPEGIAKTRSLPDLLFDPARFLQIPTLVLVGEKDVGRDAALRRQETVDALQGRNRMERARRWMAAMSTAASQFNYDTVFRFSVVPGCGHSFSDCMTEGGMGSQVIRFLLSDLSSLKKHVRNTEAHRFSSPDTHGELQ